MYRHALSALGLLALLGCDETTSSKSAGAEPEPPAAPAPSAPASAPAAAQSPASHGSMTEAEFAALHEHTGDAAPALEGSTIDLAGGKAYLSLPEGKTGPVPGVVVIHEWWGLNDHIRHWADRLAGQGYAAVAVDLYGGQVATQPEDAMAYMKKVDPAAAKKTLAAALELLRTHEKIMAPKTASIGWCFGGGWSLQTALMDPKLDGAVMYYGRPVTDAEELAKMKAKLLGVFGTKDASIPAETLTAFEAALKKAKVDATILTYPAAHAFANPSGAHYDAEQADKAWAKVEAFLTDVLAP